MLIAPYGMCAILFQDVYVKDVFRPSLVVYAYNPSILLVSENVGHIVVHRNTLYKVACIRDISKSDSCKNNHIKKVMKMIVS